MERRILFALLLMVVLPALAEDQEGVVAFPTVARVAVDAEGRPSEVSGAERLPQPIREFVETTVGGWRFEPVVVDGVARQGVTWVQLAVCAVPQGEKLALSARFVRNGPAQPGGTSLLVDAPNYPKSALIRGVTGDMEVAYTVQPDGSAVLDGIEYEGDERQLSRHFRRALQDWVSAMRFEPEMLDGQPIATRLSTPVSFSLYDPTSRREIAEHLREKWQATPECMAAEGRQPQGQLVLVESLFALRGPGGSVPLQTP
ncbi:energy transducer TonB [Luteimonas sp. A478]